MPNVGQLDRPQHGLDEPDSAVGEVVNEVGCFGPEVGDEDGDERDWSYVERKFFMRPAARALARAKQRFHGSGAGDGLDVARPDLLAAG